MASNKRDPLCATKIGSVKVVWVCVLGNPQKRAQSHVVPCRLGVCVYCARHREAKLYALNRANAIHSAPQWSVRSKLCMCVFVTLKGAQSHVVPCRLGVCVYCARHLVARLNGLKQKRSTLRHNDRFGQSCVCVCFW